MFNDNMRKIAKSLYLQTRYYRAELLVEGIDQTKMLMFGLRYIKENHWQVSDLDFEMCDESKDSILECVYKTMAMRLNKQGDHGIVLLIDTNKEFKGVLYGIEGLLGQYSSSHHNLLHDFGMFYVEDLEDNDKELLYKSKIGDPISKPEKWDFYMKMGSDPSH
jgi:hypothetical protein